MKNRSAKRPIASDLAVAALILVLTTSTGAAALWAGRHNSARRAAAPTTLVIPGTRFRMPDTIGKNAYVEFAALGSMRLKLKVTSEVSRTLPGGTVIAQSPPAGTIVQTGTVVRLTVTRRDG